MRVKRTEGRVCCKCGGDLPFDRHPSQAVEVSRRKTASGVEVLVLAPVCGTCHKPSRPGLGMLA